MAFKGAPDHVWGQVDAEHAAVRNERRDLGGHLAVAATYVKDDLIAAESKLRDQIPCPPPLLGRVALIVFGIPGELRHRSGENFASNSLDGPIRHPDGTRLVVAPG
jgi:hypothetical protein